MSTPAFVIRIPLEGAPVVYPDVEDDRAETRLRDWLEFHPAYQELIDRAIELAEEAP
jgi:hypothetical protein